MFIYISKSPWKIPHGVDKNTLLKEYLQNISTLGPRKGQHYDITCTHGIYSIVINYVIFDIPVYNQIVNFDILNGHDPDIDHRPLILTIKFVMHSIPIK